LPSIKIINQTNNPIGVVKDSATTSSDPLKLAQLAKIRADSLAKVGNIYRGVGGMEQCRSIFFCCPVVLLPFFIYICGCLEL